MDDREAQDAGLVEQALERMREGYERDGLHYLPASYRLYPLETDDSEESSSA